MENIAQTQQWKDFKIKATNIDKLAEWCLHKQTSRISQKYTSITQTLKLLKTLLSDFTKKADNLQHELIEISRVEQTQYKSAYYQKRITECLDLSQKLKNRIEEHKNNVEEKENRVRELRNQLVKLKTDNIRICLKIEENQHQQWNQLLQQNTNQQKKAKQQKCKQLRNIISSSSNNNNKGLNDNTLREKNKYLEFHLMEKIDRMLQMRKFIQRCFEVLRQKLMKQEKKSNIYGLAGSMLFKLNAGSNPLQLGQSKRQKDSKLIIYDILKQKYQRHIRSQKKKQQKLSITEEEFLQFSPLQILGVIQLKGGLQGIIDKRVLAEESKYQGWKQNGFIFGGGGENWEMGKIVDG